jgi:hypothetical protein
VDVEGHAEEGCQVCGRGPATSVDVMQVTGMVVLFRTSTVKGRLCRECATAVARRAISHNLLFGWWGLIAAFVNLFIVVANVVTLLRVRRLPQPSGDTVGPRIAPARPVLQTPGPYVAGAATIIVLSLLVGAALRSDPVGAGRVGRCVVIDQPHLRVRSIVPCDGGEDGTVIAASSSADACPAEADGALPESEGDDVLLCIDVDA